MIDLTKLNTTDIKEEIFNLCQYVYPGDLLVEDGVETHIFHAIKISKTGDKYSVVDVAKEKPSELNNKFLLMKIKEELEVLSLAVFVDISIEDELEAAAEIAFVNEPNPVELEIIEKELKLSKIYEEEVID